MRFWAVALFCAQFPQAQDPSPETVLAAMQSRAPRFRDVELRYAARLVVEDQLEISGETRMVLVPGRGMRTDCAVLSVRGVNGHFHELKVEVSTAELGEEIYFWGALHRGPLELLDAMPLCLSMKGSRRPQGAGPDAFPADFPFRWVYEDWLSLWALAPREAFSREPGVGSACRKVVDGVDSWILEMPVPHDKAPEGSFLRSASVAKPLKRCFVEASTGRPWRMEFVFLANGEPFGVRCEAKSWKEVSGVSVPAEIETELIGRFGWVPDVSRAAIRKILSFASFDRGLAAKDIFPESRRKDVHVEDVVRPTEHYDAAIQKDPRDASAWAGRALARYKKVIGQRVKQKVDYDAVICDLEQATALAPGAPSPAVSLLMLLDGRNESEKASSFARVLEDRNIDSDDVRMALSNHWLAAGDWERALRHLGRIRASADSPLSLRIAVVEPKVVALASSGERKGAGRALIDLLRGAAGAEAEVIVDAFSSGQDSRMVRVGEGNVIRDAIEAALEIDSRSWPLHEMRLRHAWSAGDGAKLIAALESFADAVEAPDALDRAARMAVDFEWGDLSACVRAAENIARKAPASEDARFFLGLAYVKAGRKDAAIPLLGGVLGGVEREKIGPENAQRLGKRLGILGRAFFQAGRDDLLIGACRVFIRCANVSRSPHMLLRGDQDDPISLCVGALLAKSKHVEVFQLLRELDQQRFDYLHGLRRIMRPFEQEFIRAVKDHVLAGSRDPADFRKLAVLIQRMTSKPQEAIQVLEKALELSPGSVDIIQQLALLCMGPGGDRERAIGLYEDLLKEVAKRPSPGVDRDHTLFMIAHLQNSMGRAEAAAAALDRMNLEAPSIAGSLMSVGAMYERAGRLEMAIAAIRRFADLYKDVPGRVTSETCCRLGALYEKVGRPLEAYRFYTRGIEAAKREVSRRWPVQAAGGAAAPDPEAMREALLTRVGRDFFIDEFLGGRFEPLAPDEEQRLMEFYGRLGSDSAAEREEAEAGIRAIGPRAAPFIKGGLGSSDAEFRERVRRIFMDWSEPR